MSDSPLDDTRYRGSDLAAELDGDHNFGDVSSPGRDADDTTEDPAEDTAEFGDALGLAPDTFALWNGDQGTLDAKQRDTLVALLKKSFISADDTVAWRTLMRDPGPIVTSLNNLYFILVVDERAEVAYATPARNADNPFKTLVRDAPNNREETLLLIYLRERHRAETASGQSVVFADVKAMLDYVERFRPASATDISGNEKRVHSAIAGLVTAGLLVKTSDADRYRVHRAIEALLTLNTLNQLVEVFRAHNSGQHQADGEEDGHDTPDSPDGAPTAQGHDEPPALIASSEFDEDGEVA